MGLWVLGEVMLAAEARMRGEGCPAAVAKREQAAVAMRWEVGQWREAGQQRVQGPLEVGVHWLEGWPGQELWGVAQPAVQGPAIVQ